MVQAVATEYAGCAFGGRISPGGSSVPPAHHRRGCARSASTRVGRAVYRGVFRKTVRRRPRFVLYVVREPPRAGGGGLHPAVRLPPRRPRHAGNRRGERIMSQDAGRRKAVAGIEKNYGKGPIMRLGVDAPVDNVPVISTGAISLDAALGIGGIPRGRVTEIFGPESSGKTTLA